MYAVVCRDDKGGFLGAMYGGGFWIPAFAGLTGFGVVACALVLGTDAASLGLPHYNPDGGGVEGVDGVAGLGAVGDYGEGVHFGLEFDEVAGLGVAFD